MKSKLEQLAELVSPLVRVEDLKRLDDGELAHIGDAVIAGKKINVDGGYPRLVKIHFNGSPDLYAIKQEMKFLNGFEYPAPETEAPEVGTPYCVPDMFYGGYTASIWRNDTTDKARLKAGAVHLSAENAIAHTQASIKASGGEV